MFIIAPIMGWHRSIHDVLNHKESIRMTLNRYGHLPLRVYVVIRPDDEAFPMLFHATINEYCMRNGIVFQA